MEMKVQSLKLLIYRATDQHPSKFDRGQDVVSATEKDDIPPDGGYGWVCVACNFLINAHTWGINSSYGVFLAHYLANNTFPDTSSLEYAFVGGLSISMAMLIAPVATKTIHLCGTRTCLFIGVFLQTLSLIGSSFAKQIWQLFLSQGVCFGWGMGFLFVASVGIPAQWFLKKRSLANAVCAAGSGLGGLVYSLATQRMIDTLSLAWAFRILGVVSLFVNLTASALLRDRNKAVGARHNAFDFSLLKRPEFLLLQGWSYFSMLGYVTLLFSLANYARSIGLTARQGSVISALLNLGQMAGRPLIGLSSDRYGRLNISMLCTLFSGIFCLTFWIPAEAASSRYGLTIFFAIVGGALAGTFWTTIAPVGAEVIGLKNLPSGLSWTWVLMVPPTTFAEPIALKLRRPGTSLAYIDTQIFTALMYVGGALCLWILKGWKVGELEEMETRLTRKVDPEKSAGADGNQVVLPYPIARKGWLPKDLIRRMCKVRKV